MIGVKLAQDYLETILLTGRVKNAEPVSSFFIAAPESGKTSIVVERECKSALVLTDVTGKSIQQICTMQAQLTHLIINDMTAVMAHGSKVNAYTQAMLMAVTEEGIRTVAMGGNSQSFERGKRGVIAAVTLDMVRDKRSWWNRSGFASRMVPFCYQYTDSLVLKIKDAICSPGFSPSWEKTKSHIIIPDGGITVRINQSFSTRVGEIADKISKDLGEVGIRRTKQFRYLALGNALKRGWKNPQVNEKDMEFLETLRPYISYVRPGAL